MLNQEPPGPSQEAGMIGLAEHGEPENNRTWTFHSQDEMSVACSIEDLFAT